MNNKKIYLPLFIGLAVAVGILIGSTFSFENKSVLFSTNLNEAKIKRLINYIQYDYVDEVDTDSLLDTAISNMLVKLDPHSVYIPKEELQQVTENMQGKFVGIGVQFVVHEDSVAITNVIEGGPSEKAGIKAGDRIIVAAEDTLFGENLLKKAKIDENERHSFRAARDKKSAVVMNSLKGEPETSVDVSVYRRSTDEILKIHIRRGEVPIKSVSGHYMLTDDLGYINIERFARTTYKEFRKALIELISEGMTSLVLDLRGNPGGFMDISNRIADEFLESGKLIVFTKNKHGEVDKSFATKAGRFEDGNVYVLIDQNSASASEIVAGALQDNDKGTIVGRRSFGKGLVQQEMDLGDGSAVRLTTSRYYTPTGRSIQKPYSIRDKNYNRDYLDRAYSGELVSKDSIKMDEALKFVTPKGKVVYGGGGIIPDVFVPIDTSSTYSNRIYRRLNDFIFRYIDNHREEMNQWELEDFVENFDKDNALLNKYIGELDLNFPLAPKVKEDLKRYFNAFVARNLFDQSAYFMITQKKDNMILKVLELENNKE
jgi:carboxyl-terminal processing protease